MKNKLRPRNQAAQALQSKIFSAKVVPSKKVRLERRARKYRRIGDF